MTADKIFSIANLIALLSWILLLVAPRFVVTRKVILSGAIPLLLSAAYLILIVMFFGKADGAQVRNERDAAIVAIPLGFGAVIAFVVAAKRRRQKQKK